MRLTKNNSIPPKRINNNIAKNGEVRPFNLNNRYKITSSPSKNPRRELAKIKVVIENISKNKSVSPRNKTGNWKFKTGSWEKGEKFKTKYPSPTKLKIKTIKSQNGRLFLCIA